MFGKKSALRVAEVELEQAKLELLRSQTALEYAKGHVQYNAARVERLTAYVKAERSEELKRREEDRQRRYPPPRSLFTSLEIKSHDGQRE